ncbi:hypothetical protein ATANTOWER_012270 [Ataeniobius toweri]|uniref:Secreted protein n=1 Tax=Ataeniobius toweri TaxID=208326 RepID=A0ABU7BS80_9TELE|nr:hypothetical protein [Ataeniobius toweri]
MMRPPSLSPFTPFPLWLCVDGCALLSLPLHIHRGATTPLRRTDPSSIQKTHKVAAAEAHFSPRLFSLFLRS